MQDLGAGPAYDAIADDYDGQLQEAAWMRHILWKHYARLIRSEDRILDVGCGTGADALFLARRGVRVTAIDVSRQMIERLQGAAEREGLAGQIETRIMDYEDLGIWEPETFDAVISAFAALNTTPDLARFARNAARLLRTDGLLLVHLLNGFSLWDRLRLASRGRWSAAHQAARNRRRTVLVGAMPLQHYLYSPDEAYTQAFSVHFELRRAYGMGILRPARSAPHVPRAVLGALEHLEAIVRGHHPFVGWGEFFVLELAKRNGGRQSAFRFDESTMASREGS